MGTDSRPPIPDQAIVAETIRLASLAEAERHEQRPTGYPRYDLGGHGRTQRPTPARDELLSYLRGQTHKTVAGLYGLFRSGDLPAPAPAGAMKRYRDGYRVAMEPMHRAHGAADLAAKGPLADGLRRGLEHLGLTLDRRSSWSDDHLHPVPYLEDQDSVDAGL